MQMQLGTSYLPGRVYFHKLFSVEKLEICGGNPWQKQTLRNRTYILSPNGIQRLVVPVQHGGGIALTDGQIKIDYRLPWIREHKGALEAAYNTSPFFEFFREELFAIYDAQPVFLFELNFQIIQLLCRKLKSTCKVISLPDLSCSAEELTIVEQKEMPADDFLPAYPQVFGYKYPFIRQLSKLDEICNTGSSR